MQSPKLFTELCLSREALATAVAAFKFTENTAHPLSGAETTTKLKISRWFLLRK